MSEHRSSENRPGEDRQGRESPAQGGVDTDEEFEALLRVLHDADCRSILRLLEGRAMTAGEIAAESDIPTSSLYRKLQWLEDVSLLAEVDRETETNAAVYEINCDADADRRCTIHPRRIRLEAGHQFELVIDCD